MEKALITGASSGLGKEIATILISRQYKVVNISRGPSDLKGIINIKCDLSKKEDIAYLTELIRKEHQDISLLILNSGLMHRANLGEYNEEEIDYDFSVNILSVIKIVEASISTIVKNKGDIVIIGSTASFQSDADRSSVYVSTKHAVHGYIRALQAELKKEDVRVIGVYPGGFRSQFHIKAKSNLDQKDLMDPKGIGEMIIKALELPRDMEVSEIIINRKKK